MRSHAPHSTCLLRHARSIALSARSSVRSIALFSAALLVTTAALAQPAPAKRAISLDDLAKIARVGSPIISPDGAWFLYSVSRADAKEDKNHSDLFMERWDGSSNMQLTFGKEGASHPEFSPDGKYISFLSSRSGKAKGTKLWVLNRLGGEPEQFTEIKDWEIQNYEW